MVKTTLGLYDPETISHTSEHSVAYQTALDAFGLDFILTFAREASLARDEYRSRSDRFGRTLSQPDTLLLVIH